MPFSCFKLSASWENTSPQWKFSDEVFEQSATSFNNADHVAIVIHNYRWRLGLAEGERQYDKLEAKLATAPVITVPPSPWKVMPMVRHIQTRSICIEFQLQRRSW